MKGRAAPSRSTTEFTARGRSISRANNPARVQMSNRNHDDLGFDDGVDDATGKPVQTIAPNLFGQRVPSVRTFHDPGLANSNLCEKALIETVGLCGIPRHGLVQLNQRRINRRSFT